MNLKGFYFAPLIAAFLISATCASDSVPLPADKEILVFTKTKGFRHKSIETGVKAIRELGKKNDFDIEHTEDAAVFTEDNLGKYAAVVFLSTTGDILDDSQQKAMENYIKGGGGFVGIHAAADTEYQWPWYGKMVGGYFDSHPRGTPTAVIMVIDKNNAATSMLPERWERTDEWYNYKDFNDNVNVLMELDETTYEGGNMDDFHPIAWYHDFDGGRAWYTGLGHTDATYSEPLFLEHLMGGLNYAMQIP